MSESVKKPQGLTLTRSGSKFKASWKKGESYSTMQYQWDYETPNKIVQGSAHSTSSTHTDRTFSGTVKLVRIGVRGKKNGHWSDWATKSVRIYAPKKPEVTAEFIQTAMTTFSWKPVTDKHERPISTAVLQTILVQDCPGGEDAIASLKEWKDADKDNKSANGSITPVNGAGESTGLIAGKSYTRIVRVKMVGLGGESEWAYAKHVYADPYAAKNVEGTVTRTDASLNCEMSWVTPTDAGHPIDRDGVVPEWTISTPAAGMECRDDASFDPLPAQSSTSGVEKKMFTLDTAIGVDKCLFLRVTTKHDTAEIHSVPVLAEGDSVGPLASPEFTEAPAITDSTVTVKASNESEVPGSFVVDYLERPDGSVQVLGQHENNITTKVYQVSGIENVRVGIKAYVGTWDSTLKEVKDVLMESPMVWSAGNVPIAPSIDDFKVEQSTVPNTVLVSWGYSWDDADACEISWSTEPDAWISTEDPESYVVLRGLENKLAIKGIEAGQPLYVRIRYLDGVDEDAILSPYSDIKSITISTVPAVPTLNLEKQFFTQGEPITCSWVYVTTDGTEQAQAHIAERIGFTEDNKPIYGDPITTVETEQKTTIENTWATGTQHFIAVQVANGSGNWSEWSEAVAVTIAEPITCEITETSLVYDEIPINPETYTGNPITFDSGEQEKEVTSLNVSLLPKQDGTPSQDSTVYNEPYLSKTSPSFNSEYDKLVGGTVAWNQLLPDGTRANTNNGISYTRADSAPYILNGTATANAVFLLNVRNLQAIKNHKYLFYGGKSTNVYLQLTTVSVWSGGVNPQDAGAGNIANAAQDGEYAFVLIVKSGTTVTNESVNPQLFDLTQMFGSTIADYIYSLETATAGAGVAWFRQLFPKDYYPYNERELISVKPTAHVTSQTYPLAGVELRGIPKISNGALYYDGDTYASDGTVTRNTILRAYQSGDESLANAITDGTNTVVYSANASTETADPYQNPQAVGSTESYTDNRTVPIPVGHESTYANIYPISGYDNVNITDSNGTDTTTKTVTLPHTVYGGNVDVIGGKDGKETWGMNDLGDLTWSYNSSVKFFQANISNIPTTSYTGIANAICSNYELGSIASVRDGSTTGIALNSAGYVYVRDLNYTDAQTFSQAMSGVQLCYELATPTDLQTTPTDVELLTGVNNISADGDMTLTIVDDIEKGDYLKSLPMTATVTGAGTGGRTTLMIMRKGDYRIERPEGEDFRGHDGEVVYQNVYPGEAQQEIQLKDLQGDFDDGARYIIRASIEDDYGQSDSDEIEFTVNWDHKAIKPSATVEMTDIAKITIAQSALAEEGDYVDIYRRSIDGAELIYTGAQFGETYVDPYPTIGNFGYLIVGRNAYGDFIMEESTGDHGQFAWYDLPAEFESERTLIDFNGEQIQLYYNVDVSHSWNKDFKKTKYLGGSIVGDYVAGVERTANVNAVSIPILEPDMLGSMRRLAKYEGNCHIRTKEGSSFTACVQVSEEDNHDKAGFVRSFSMSIEKVESVALDGMTNAEWEAR